MAAAAVAATVAAVSFAPLPPEGSAAGSLLYAVPYTDLLLHFLGYLVFAAFVACAVSASTASDRRLLMEAALTSVVVFGFAVELLQGVLPHRSFSYVDAGVNAAGVACVYIYVVSRRLRSTGTA